MRVSQQQTIFFFRLNFCLDLNAFEGPNSQKLLFLYIEIECTRLKPYKMKYKPCATDQHTTSSFNVSNFLTAVYQM